MDDYKLNFLLCTYMCTCGYYRFSWDFARKSIDYAIQNNLSSIPIAFCCKRCGKMIALEFIISKNKYDENEYFIKNKFLFATSMPKIEKKKRGRK